MWNAALLCARRSPQAVRRVHFQPHLDAALEWCERELLALMAQGMSNQLIAEKLEIGEKTVKSHVSNILGKLHVADRTQAAVFAWRRGLVRDEPAR